MNIDSIQSKIMSWEHARVAADILRANHRKIVFTNGCFDLMHIGHLRYLAEARDLGDFLFVGLNSDRSVREIKGPKRPIVPAEQRAEVLAGWSVVDAVVIFDEPDPLRLIELLQPDVLVKGGDWPIDRIIGREVVQRRGGRVLTIPLIPDVSTTRIVDRILALHSSSEGPEETP